MCVWAAPFSGLAAAPPLPRSWLEDFHAVCYLAVDRWTTSRTVPGTERTHHQPGQSPVKHNQDSVFNKNQTNKQKSQKKKKQSYGIKTISKEKHLASLFAHSTTLLSLLLG